MTKAFGERNPSVTRYLQEIKQYTPLTREEEQEVGLRMQTPGMSEEAVNELVRANLRFVIRVANQHRSMGLPFEDLVNEGNIGLIEAARRFDPSHGTKFVSYAMWWIRRSILRAVMENASIVRVPEYQMKRVREVKRVGRKLSREMGRVAGREEISEEMGIDLARVDALLQMQPRSVSLDEQCGRSEETTLKDQLVDDRVPDPEEEMARRQTRGVLRRALRALSGRQRSILTERFGLAGKRERTLKEIGTELGMSRERVRQIEVEAGRRLRKIMIRRMGSGAAGTFAVSRTGS